MQFSFMSRRGTTNDVLILKLEEILLYVREMLEEILGQVLRFYKCGERYWPSF